MASPFKVSFHGAAGTVTGSKHLITAGDARVLLDAGLFQGRKELRQRNWEPPAFDPASVDHLLLSHTHIDHVGYLPRLVKLGLRAPVHLTPAAHDLARLMLLDSAKIQEEDARYANKKKYSKHKPALPLYTSEDAEAALELRRKQPYKEWLELRPGLRARFHAAGHILGAAFIELRIETGGREVRVVFSGDIGRFEVPLHLDPEPLPACDVLIIESTYGNRLHTHTPVVDQVAQPFRETLSQGGTILIPAFAVGRSQLITLMLRQMMKQRQLPEVPIHIDSPMAVDATAIYSRFLNERNIDPDVFDDGRLRLFPEKVELHRRVADSKRLNELRGPRIIVSPSGMMTAGRVLHHLRRLAGDRRNLIVLAGYQAEGTRGRHLAEGARTIKIHGRPVPVRCRVMPIQGLSGHADRDELVRWVESAPEPPKLAFMVHGEPPASEALARLFEERFGLRALLPELDEEFDLAELLAGGAAARSEAAGATVEAEAPQVPDDESAAAIAAATAPKLTVAEPPAEDLEAPTRLRQVLDGSTYLRADQDVDFLQREEVRPYRLGLEYLKPELVLQSLGVDGTVVVFGGARVLEPAAARRHLAAARAAAEAEPGDAELARLVAVAEKRMELSRYYQVARELGRTVGRQWGGHDHHRLLIVTGGGPGIMEAANRGAADVGAPSVGLNITLPHEQTPNAYVTPELCFLFRYFAIRKMHFLLRARALVFMPGGYGTLDELFESLCLVQTRKLEPLPIVLVGKEYWSRTADFDYLAEVGTISPEDRELFAIVETAEEAWDHIKGWYDDAGAEIWASLPATP